VVSVVDSWLGADGLVGVIIYDIVGGYICSSDDEAGVCFWRRGDDRPCKGGRFVNGPAEVTTYNSNKSETHQPSRDGRSGV